MELAEDIGRFGVKDEAVQVVCQDLVLFSGRNRKMDRTETYFPDHESFAEIFGDTPWHWKSRGDFECASNLEDFGEQELDSRLKCDAEADVEETKPKDLIPLRCCLFPACSRRTTGSCW